MELSRNSIVSMLIHFKRRANEHRAKMILGSYVIIRILLLEVIMRPWQVLPKTAQDKINLRLRNKRGLTLIYYRNLLNIGSIFYHALTDVFRTNLQPNKDNQAFVHPEDRVLAVKELLSATGKI